MFDACGRSSHANQAPTWIVILKLSLSHGYKVYSALIRHTYMFHHFTFTIVIHMSDSISTHHSGCHSCPNFPQPFCGCSRQFPLAHPRLSNLLFEDRIMVRPRELREALFSVCNEKSSEDEGLWIGGVTVAGWGLLHQFKTTLSWDLYTCTYRFEAEYRLENMHEIVPIFATNPWHGGEKMDLGDIWSWTVWIEIGTCSYIFDTFLRT